MKEERLEQLISETRLEFQIPPFFADTELKNYAKEGTKYLLTRNPLADTETDETFCMLLKNYIYYAYYHRVNEWKENYKEMILEWVLTNEVVDEVTNDDESTRIC